MAKTKEKTRATFNLQDVITLLPRVKTDYKSNKSFMEYMQLLSDMRTSERMMNRSIKGCAKNIEWGNEHANKLESHRRKAISELGFVPDELKYKYHIKITDSWEGYLSVEMRYTKDDVFFKNNNFQASLADLRELSDSLGMVIMPWEYHNKGSLKMTRRWDSEESSIERQVKKFADAFKEGYKLYVVSPILYYDVISHVKSENPNLPIYGETHRHTLMSVNLQIPLFRTIINNIQSLKSDQMEIRTTLKQVESNIEQVQIQMKDLQAQVDSQKIQMIEEKLKTKRLEKEIKQLREVQIQFIDPLLIAIPDKEDIRTSNANAVIGPCWGPDFDELAIMGLNLIIKKDQRNLLNAANEASLN